MSKDIYWVSDAMDYFSRLPYVRDVGLKDHLLLEIPSKGTDIYFEGRGGKGVTGSVILPGRQVYDNDSVSVEMPDASIEALVDKIVHGNENKIMRGFTRTNVCRRVDYLTSVPVCVFVPTLEGTFRYISDIDRYYEAVRIIFKLKK